LHFKALPTFCLSICVIARAVKACPIKTFHVTEDELIYSQGDEKLSCEYWFYVTFANPILSQ